MNIIGMGLEIVEIKSWIRKAHKIGPKFFDLYFTRSEKQYCERKKEPWIHYSARWACKKAVCQALGLSSDFKNLAQGIEVIADNHGRPQVILDKTKFSKSRHEGVGQIKVSLSHSDSFSVAEVIILGNLREQ